MKGRQRVVSSKFTWLQFSQPIRAREKHYPPLTGSENFLAPMRLLGPNIGLHFDDMAGSSGESSYPGTYDTRGKFRSSRNKKKNSNFRSLLLHLSDSLTRKEFQELKLLCGDVVPRDKLETINHGLKLFDALEHVNKLSVRDRDFLASKLIAVNRTDLRNQLLEIEG